MKPKYSLSTFELYLDIVTQGEPSKATPDVED